MTEGLRETLGDRTAAIGRPGPSDPVWTTPVPVYRRRLCGRKKNERGRVFISGGRNGSPGLRQPWRSLHSGTEFFRPPSIFLPEVGRHQLRPVSAGPVPPSHASGSPTVTATFSTRHAPTVAPLLVGRHDRGGHRLFRTYPHVFPQARRSRAPRFMATAGSRRRNSRTRPPAGRSRLLRGPQRLLDRSGADPARDRARRRHSRARGARAA
jgi:hypothetical protein